MSNKTPTNPSHEAISERARILWTAAGSPPTGDMDFWLRAERELTQEATASDQPEVIDLERDTAYGQIDSVPNLSGGSKTSVSLGAGVGGPNESRKGTSL